MRTPPPALCARRTRPPPPTPSWPTTSFSRIPLRCAAHTRAARRAPQPPSSPSAAGSTPRASGWAAPAPRTPPSPLTRRRRCCATVTTIDPPPQATLGCETAPALATPGLMASGTGQPGGAVAAAALAGAGGEPAALCRPPWWNLSLGHQLGLLLDAPEDATFVGTLVINSLTNTAFTWVEAPRLLRPFLFGHAPHFVSPPPPRSAGRALRGRSSRGCRCTSSWCLRGAPLTCAHTTAPCRTPG